MQRLRRHFLAMCDDTTNICSFSSSALDFRIWLLFRSFSKSRARPVNAAKLLSVSWQASGMTTYVVAIAYHMMCAFKKQCERRPGRGVEHEWTHLRGVCLKEWYRHVLQCPT